MSTNIHIPQLELYQCFRHTTGVKYEKNGGKSKQKIFVLSATCKFCQHCVVDKGKDKKTLKNQHVVAMRNHLNCCVQVKNNIALTKVNGRRGYAFVP